MPETTERFETWALVEIMGHKQLAGMVSEFTLAGAGMLRVDVPDVPGEPGVPGRSSGHSGMPGFTKLLSPSAIYAITPVEEGVARQLVASLRERPIEVWRLDTTRALPPARPADLEQAYLDAEVHPDEVRPGFCVPAKVWMDDDRPTGARHGLRPELDGPDDGSASRCPLKPDCAMWRPTETCDTCPPDCCPLPACPDRTKEFFEPGCPCPQAIEAARAARAMAIETCAACGSVGPWKTSVEDLADDAPDGVEVPLCDACVAPVDQGGPTLEAVLRGIAERRRIAVEAPALPESSPCDDCLQYRDCPKRLAAPESIVSCEDQASIPF